MGMLGIPYPLRDGLLARGAAEGDDLALRNVFPEMPDRLTLRRALESSAMPQADAERIATEIYDAIYNNVATKADLREPEQQLDARFEALERQFSRMVTRLESWWSFASVSYLSPSLVWSAESAECCITGNKIRTDPGITIFLGPRASSLTEVVNSTVVQERGSLPGCIMMIFN
jgi:hypothetical protein